MPGRRGVRSDLLPGLSLTLYLSPLLERVYGLLPGRVLWYHEPSKKGPLFMIMREPKVLKFKNVRAVRRERAGRQCSNDRGRGSPEWTVDQDEGASGSSPVHGPKSPLAGPMGFEPGHSIQVASADTNTMKDHIVVFGGIEIPGECNLLGCRRTAALFA